MARPGRLGAAARPWLDREIRPAAPGRKGANVCTRGSRPTRLGEWTVDPGGAGRGSRGPGMAVKKGGSLLVAGAVRET